jgi:hypothetical protein
MPKVFSEKLRASLSPQQQMALWIVRSGSLHRHPPNDVQKFAAATSERFAVAGQGEPLDWLLRVAMGEIKPSTAAEIAALRAALDEVIGAIQGR